MKIEAYACQHCGTRCTRSSARGQKPKWCSQRCADLGKRAEQRVCTRCGAAYVGLGKKFCSRSCAAAAGNTMRCRAVPKQPTLPIDRRSDLRAAVENGDCGRVISAVRALCAMQDGCWIWTRRLHHSGYPVVVFGKRYHQVHRLVLEAKLRAPLGTQAAHHKCAVPACVNPDHLQPVTHRDNTAEMLARQSYLARIRELEAALGERVPDHPLLTVAPVA